MAVAEKNDISRWGCFTKYSLINPIWSTLKIRWGCSAMAPCFPPPMQYDINFKETLNYLYIFSSNILSITSGLWNVFCIKSFILWHSRHRGRQATVVRSKFVDPWLLFQASLESIRGEMAMF